MNKIEFAKEEIEDLSYWRYHHPHPRVRRKMEALFPKSRKLSHRDICRFTDISGNTLRNYLNEYKEGGIEKLKEVSFYKPRSELAVHKSSIETYFTEHPPTCVKEAMAKIEELTGIRRSENRVREYLGIKRMVSYISFIRANYLSLFPDLPDQSQSDRRSRNLCYLLEELRRSWAKVLGVLWENHFLIDTTPVIAVGYRRDKRHGDFFGSADYGFCAARQMKYFGSELVMLTTLSGIPFTFELVPASTDERDAADKILASLPSDSDVWADKGFLGEDWQEQGIRVWTAKRKNRHNQNDPKFDRLLGNVRERIESVFDLLKEGGRSVGHTRDRTIGGLATRVISKISSLILKLFLRKFFGIDILTYTTN